MTPKTITWILFVALAVMQIPVWFTNGGWLGVIAQQKALRSLQSENELKVIRNQQLRADVDDLADQGRGQAAVDERARYRLGMMKTNEVFIQVVAPK